jgi:hypothetical protein
MVSQLILTDGQEEKGDKSLPSLSGPYESIVDLAFKVKSLAARTFRCRILSLLDS